MVLRGSAWLPSQGSQASSFPVWCVPAAQAFSAGHSPPGGSLADDMQCAGSGRLLSWGTAVCLVTCTLSHPSIYVKTFHSFTNVQHDGGGPAVPPAPASPSAPGMVGVPRVTRQPPPPALVWALVRY